MADSFAVFCRTLQIGEQLLGLSYSDYQDAYDFSIKHFSVHSDHFVDHFENHSDLNEGEYEYDLVRYFFIKAIEHRIASDLYANTSRGNMCDVFWSPFDIDMDSYPTNLPKHLERIVNANQTDAARLAKAVMKELKSNNSYRFGPDVLNAILFIGQTIGYHIGKANTHYKGYACSEMLTRNELNGYAVLNLCNWLKGNGFEIEASNTTRDTVQNIIATKDSHRVYVLLSAEVAPEDPGFLPLDLDNLYNAAEEEGAIPYYASVSLGSANDAHFQDGVLLYGDQVRFRVNAVGELEKE